MNLQELLAWRVRELREFFQGYFGRGWKKKLARNFGASVAPHCLRKPHTTIERANFLFRWEDYALTLGFKPTAPVPVCAFERKYGKRIRQCIVTITRQLFVQTQKASLVPRFVDAHKVLAHRMKHKMSRSDVLPIDLCVFPEAEHSIARPVSPALTLTDLLLAPVADPRPLPPAPLTGAIPTP